MMRSPTCSDCNTSSFATFHSFLTFARLKEHDTSLTTMQHQMNEQNESLRSFQDEVKATLSKTNSNLQHLSKRVDEMPHTIQICTNQVKHKIDEDMDDHQNELHNDPSTGETLKDIINQQEQRAFLHEEAMKTTNEKITEQGRSIVQVKEEMDADVVGLRKDVSTLIEWKNDQSTVDLTDIQRSQDSIFLSIDALGQDLLGRVTRSEVESKLEGKFNEIVDHLQTALVSVEKDEEDFKAVTEHLNRMYQSLRDDKADKTDITSLRQQFIQNQVDATLPSGGSTLNNEDIRQVLARYPTSSVVEQLLDEKIDKDIVLPRLDRTDAVVQGVYSTLEELLSMVRRGASLEHGLLEDVANETKVSSKDGTFCDSERKSQTKKQLASQEEPSEGQLGESDSVTNTETMPLHEKEGQNTQNETKASCPSGKRQRQNRTPHQVIVQLPLVCSQPRPAQSISLPGEKQFNSSENDGMNQMEGKSLQQNNSEGNGVAPQMGQPRPNTSNTVHESTQEQDFPIINKDRMKLNPGISYGGGFQVVPPRKQEKQPLRALDQYKAVLPVVETKKMVAGNDGKFYVSSRHAGTLESKDQKNGK